MWYCYDNIDKYDVKKAYKELGLDASWKFNRASDETIKEYSNGMGAEGAIYNELIPDTIWGLDISIISVAHDFDYTFGKSQEDADERFYQNGLTLVKRAGGNFVLQWLRRRRMKFYKKLLQAKGAAAFKEGHDKVKKKPVTRHKYVKSGKYAGAYVKGKYVRKKDRIKQETV